MVWAFSLSRDYFGRRLTANWAARDSLVAELGFIQVY